MSDQPSISNSDVSTLFDNYPDAMRTKLLRLRELILEVVAENSLIGDIQETLKWGQISYLPVKRNVGTTIRIDQRKENGKYAIYVPCSTSLLDRYRSIYADTFEFEGDRAIILNVDDDLPVEAIKHCIEMALTYHLNK